MALQHNHYLRVGALRCRRCANAQETRGSLSGSAAVAVAMGAFGAHGLKKLVTEDRLQVQATSANTR